jgi:ribosomal protein L21
MVILLRINFSTLKIEKLEVEPGKSITFEDVLMVADGDKVEIGAPLVAKASVEAKVLKYLNTPTVSTLLKKIYYD